MRKVKGKKKEKKGKIKRGKGEGKEEELADMRNRRGKQEAKG